MPFRRKFLDRNQRFGYNLHAFSSNIAGGTLSHERQAMLIRKQAFARAGLIGNPSDGYFGKTISIIIRNFSAEVELSDSPELRIIPGPRDDPRSYAGLDELVSDIELNGYYGGVRLVKAIIKRFAQFCRDNAIELEPKNFSISYDTNVPCRVGLAGSSAIVTATIRALKEFYGVAIPREVQPSIVLSAERDELDIGAGLQDRVIQTYEGMVFMDFSKEIMDAKGTGEYEALDPALLPPLFVAYDAGLSEGSEVFHNNIRERFERGEEKVVSAMRTFAEITDAARGALLGGQPEKIGPLMSENFDLRRSLFRLSDRNIRMVEIARQAGAHAKFAGSGGAAIGTYASEKMFQKLAQAYREAGFETFKPLVSDATGKE